MLSVLFLSIHIFPQANLIVLVCYNLSAPLASSPVWARDFSSSEELITEFCRECRIVRKGISYLTVETVLVLCNMIYFCETCVNL